MRSGRSWVLWESYGEPKFVSPFEDYDGVVGRRFFQDWVAQNGGRIDAAPPDAGIVGSLDDLASDAFAPGEVHPLVREVYEHTTVVSFLAQKMTLTWLGWLFHYPYNLLIARPMQQLDIPIQPGLLPRRIVSQVSLLDSDRDGDVDWRIWVRTYDGTERVFYVGAVSTHRVDGPQGSQVYLDVNLPLWNACISVVFQPVNLPHGGLTLRTRTEGSYEAGMYLVFPSRKHFSMMPIPGMHEEIQVRPHVDANGVEGVTGRHITSLAAWTMYEIPYTLTRQPASPASPAPQSA